MIIENCKFQNLTNGNAIAIRFIKSNQAGVGNGGGQMLSYMNNRITANGSTAPHNHPGRAVGCQSGGAGVYSRPTAGIDDPRQAAFAFANNSNRRSRLTV
ncbi:hypothetical protein [Bradyrhizobium jicamae]|uniref:hypothetical protein n=1 Tax=Bradyrhizobium jicamae TaxID=280332 RepID=UPI001BAA22DF|nr:hypothetical protein [Bradyrhizobium jicamae]